MRICKRFSKDLHRCEAKIYVRPVSPCNFLRFESLHYDI